MAECASIHFDARNFSRRMSDKIRFIMTNSLQLRLRKKSAISKHGIKSLNGMALALDITITMGSENFGRHVKNTVIKHV